jgi:RNA polymerase sigma factor (sigma-70 family)
VTLQLDFQEIYEKYSKRLFHAVYPIIRDRFLAEDVVQETFLKAYKKMDTIIDEQKIGAWLSSIAVRTAIDLVRKESKGIVMEDVAVEKECNKTFQLSNVEQEVEISLLKEELQRVINLLNKEHQEIFLLKINDGLKEEEIANKLKLKPATIKTRIYRIRKHLKSIYYQRYTA